MSKEKINLPVFLDDKLDLNTYTMCLNVNVREEYPTKRFRWLKKKDGTRLLQQLFDVRDNMFESFRAEWKNVEEVEEVEE